MGGIDGLMDGWMDGWRGVASEHCNLKIGILLGFKKTILTQYDIVKLFSHTC